MFKEEGLKIQSEEQSGFESRPDNQVTFNTFFQESLCETDPNQWLLSEIVNKYKDYIHFRHVSARLRRNVNHI